MQGRCLHRVICGPDPNVTRDIAELADGGIRDIRKAITIGIIVKAGISDPAAFADLNKAPHLHLCQIDIWVQKGFFFAQTRHVLVLFLRGADQTTTQPA